jgi:3-oxoacyl-[acyl-carrier protein] reductase
MLTREQTHESLIAIGEEARCYFSRDLFAGKVALVTGGSRGIGRSTAIGLGALGAKVIVNYCRGGEAAEDVVQAIESLDGTASSSCFDVGDEKMTQTSINEIISETQGVDILINNAGIGAMKPIVNMSEKDLDSILAANLNGTFFLCQSAIPEMVKRGAGKIVNISSLAAFAGMPLQSAYAASKAAILGMTRSMSKEVAAAGVQVNAVAPGVIMTDLFECVDEGVKQKVISTIPAARGGSPDEVAWVAIYLASPAADYITGYVCTVDGGIVTR